MDEVKAWEKGVVEASCPGTRYPRVVRFFGIRIAEKLRFEPWRPFEMLAFLRRPKLSQESPIHLF